MKKIQIVLDLNGKLFHGKIVECDENTQNEVESLLKSLSKLKFNDFSMELSNGNIVYLNKFQLEKVVATLVFL